MTQRQTPPLSDLEIPQIADIPEDVVPLYGTDKKELIKPNKAKLFYDVAMLALLIFDLLLMAIDAIMMSGFMLVISKALGFGGVITHYTNHLHLSIDAVGGAFTIFWVIELSIRWLRAIIKKTYYRWFFFPFVHWYEVLACFPVLRALRLLRAGIIIKNLHNIGIVIIPERWLKSAQFYYHVLLEELSDRVILTAIDNFRAQLAHSKNHKDLIQNTIDKNRDELEVVILNLLRTELTPKLQSAFLSHTGNQLSQNIGVAVENALSDTPELRKYLRLIPIAGSMIENQITHIGKNVGENVTQAINEHLFHDNTLDKLMIEIAQGISRIDTDRPELQALVNGIIEDALNAFEKQVKTQQWKHKEQLPI